MYVITPDSERKERWGLAHMGYCVDPDKPSPWWKNHCLRWVTWPGPCGWQDHCILVNGQGDVLVYVRNHPTDAHHWKRTDTAQDDQVDINKFNVGGLGFSCHSSLHDQCRRLTTLVIRRQSKWSVVVSRSLTTKYFSQCYIPLNIPKMKSLVAYIMHH